MITAEIIAIGTELLTPFRTDTNSLWLTEQLNSVGIDVKLKTIVGDDEERLEEAIRDAMKRSDIIISTGGLGPTEDDITRKVFAKVTGRQLMLDYEVLAQIRERFTSRGYSMTPNNERQALIPRGALVLSNPNGTAPGIKIEQDGRLMVLLPGPPRELQPMFSTHIRPELERISRGVRIHRRVLKVAGLGESALDDMIAPVYRGYSNPSTTILFTSCDVEIHLTAFGENESVAEDLAEELADKLADKLGDYVYSTSGEPLEKVVGERLALKRFTIATAESCTGGLVAERLTEVPGASAYFVGGVVSYTEEQKIRLLGVSRDVIANRGVVSGDVAQAMAAGIRGNTGAAIGLSVTGIAGPSGGTDAVPVGTVYVGIASDAGVSNRRFVLPGDRNLIRWRASQAALDMVRRRHLL
jgi:nicotinamide-nucleotide amidase